MNPIPADNGIDQAEPELYFSSMFSTATTEYRAVGGDQGAGRFPGPGKGRAELLKDISTSCTRAAIMMMKAMVFR